MKYLSKQMSMGSGAQRERSPAPVSLSSVPPCWAVPHKPASLVVTQPQDLESRDSNRDISGLLDSGSYTSKKKKKGSWSDTPLSMTNTVQDVAAIFTNCGRRR